MLGFFARRAGNGLESLTPRGKSLGTLLCHARPTPLPVLVSLIGERVSRKEGCAGNISNNSSEYIESSPETWNCGGRDRDADAGDSADDEEEEPVEVD